MRRLPKASSHCGPHVVEKIAKSEGVVTVRGSFAGALLVNPHLVMNPKQVTTTYAKTTVPHRSTPTTRVR